MAERTRIILAGAQGRMGRAVIEAAAADEDVAVVAAFGRGDAERGSPTDRVLRDCDVVVDFSTPLGASQIASRLAGLASREVAPAMVIGVTGFPTGEESVVVRASESLAIVRSANFSIGVNVALALVVEAAARLPAQDWDIEIIEAHHRMKRDAPSGTALAMGEAAARGRNVALEAVRAAAPRHGDGQRREGEIGFASIRAGGLVGEHAVVFAAGGEMLMISHSARDRSCFARGALLAAKWVRRRRAGLYGMADVLLDGPGRDEP